MALKTFNPTTPSRRQLVIVDRSELWKGKPVKSLTEGLRGKGGRNNTGRITMRRRGGGSAASGRPCVTSVIAQRSARVKLARDPIEKPLSALQGGEGGARREAMGG